MHFGPNSILPRFPMPAPSEPTSQPPLLRRVSTEGASRELIAEVRAALAQGQLVALPTETVYGIAARADDPRALERLRSAKGRPAELPLSWHVGSAEVLRSFAHLRPLAQRLAATYWPGPLTLVLEGVPSGLQAVAKQGWTGVRMPAQPTTLGILQALDFPVVMTSANHHGRACLGDAGSLERELGAHLALIVDAGPSPLAEGSAVLRLGHGCFELLRPGLMELEHLREVAGLRLGFVCTGNTCRSPMAEGLARHALEQRLETRKLTEFGFEVSSMGVFASPGAPPSEHGVRVLRRRGIDIAQHRSQGVPLDRLGGFDALYCLTQSHRQALLGALPPGQGQGIVLLDPEGRDISDPIGGSLGDYEACAAMIADAIEARLAHWA